MQAGTSRQAKQYGAVDNLSYAYQGNRLQAVDDAVSGNQLPQPATYHGAPTSLAGDFQEAGVKQGQEYLYDANGNLTADQNKGITGILYNHLNLPRQIHFGQGADSVVFRYAASGQKVAKLVYQTGQPTPGARTTWGHISMSRTRSNSSPTPRAGCCASCSTTRPGNPRFRISGSSR